MGEKLRDGWHDLMPSERVLLFAEGLAFPGETEDERRCRLKNQLGLLDDADLAALLGCTEETLAKHRVKGTGPRPIRIARNVFYLREDVEKWLRQNRDIE